jgi:hypothetical protein
MQTGMERTVSQTGETAQFGDNQPQHDSFVTAPVNRLDNPTDQEQVTVRVAQEAWHRLRHDQTWDDWKRVGAAHVLGRNGAMHEAGVNRPLGRRYKAAFAAWLKKFGFENLDKADRSRLFVVMDHLEEIETWRATLTPPQQLCLNHPSGVLRKWKSAHAASRNQNCRLSPIEMCREHCSEAGDLSLTPRMRAIGARWNPAVRPEDATVMVANLRRSV